MLQLIKNRKAVSAALSTVMFISIMIIAAVLIYMFVNSDIENIIDTTPTNPFNVRIANVRFNETHITINILNAGENEITIERVYINKELRAFTLIDHDLKVAAGTSKDIYVFGSYLPGSNFEIKVVFESGNSLSTMERW